MASPWSTTKRRCLLTSAMLVAFIVATGRSGSAGGSTAFTAAATTFQSYFSQLVVSLIPGFGIAGGAYALYKNSGSQPKVLLYTLSALLAMAALATPIVLESLSVPQKEVRAEVQLRSGEFRLMQNGKFIFVSDPRPGSGPAQEGWQQALWTEMAEAISKGEEQVVMVFSRPGCPWCEKLHPVLENAIKRRADFLASGAGAGENQTDQVDQPSLLHSPLRIFVYDASEFAPIIRRFGIEGFPTIYFFGPPGSRPTVVPGYLSDQDFDKVCKSAAESEVEPEPQERKRKRGFFR